MSNVIAVREYKTKKCDLSDRQIAEYREMKKMAKETLERTYNMIERVRQFEEDHHIMWHENKQMVADAFCLLLQMTRAGGTSNHVVKMKYEVDERGDEHVIPVLADGNDEWYKVNVSGDSGVAMIKDITNQFVTKAW